MTREEERDALETLVTSDGWRWLVEKARARLNNLDEVQQIALDPETGPQATRDWAVIREYVLQGLLAAPQRRIQALAKELDDPRGGALPAGQRRGRGQ